MKNLLIISFDIIHDNAPKISYSIASLLQFLKSKADYGKKYKIEHLSINIDQLLDNQASETLFRHLNSIEINSYDFIALSVYVWSKQYVRLSNKYLKNKGFKGRIILGGNEISYSSNSELHTDYPLADIFVKRYAEQALFEILTNSNNSKKVYDISTPVGALGQVYSTKGICLDKANLKVRFETKRGCPFNCSFCAHKDKNSRKIEELNFENVVQELRFLNKTGVAKVNILDPVFNTGNYLNVLEAMVKMKFRPQLSLQTRFELIRGKQGKRFLDFCEQLNVTLEFGLQTIIASETKVINRKNDAEKIAEVLKELNARSIDYETSLIYGLPNQTVDTFKESIEFLKLHGNKKVVAFPLMLLKGTELYQKRKTWNLTEAKLGEYNLPHVISSNTFNIEQYKQMEQIANTLN